MAEGQALNGALQRSIQRLAEGRSSGDWTPYGSFGMEIRLHIGHLVELAFVPVDR